MSSSQILPPISPGFAARRKGTKPHPKLPLSAFTPPNSGTSDKFPLSLDPSTVHPDSVIDAHVVLAGSDLSQWRKEAGEVLGGRIGGVVLSLHGTHPEEVEKAVADLKTTDLPFLSLLVPFTLESAPPNKLPFASVKGPLALTTTYVKSSAENISTLKWALENAHTVDIQILNNLTSSEESWDGFEDLLTKATADLPKQTPLILSNILPPPDDIELPIVKLMNHPTYRAYQSHTAALSLFPNLYVKFIPPFWSTPSPDSKDEQEGSKEKKEWKRRIKMYLGPVLEAFGYQRIIFGSAPSSPTPESNAGDWYEIARESFAELGVEQETIDAVFAGNAKKVYGS